MQSCSVCIYLYIHTVMNTTILQLVAIYNIQLHVSALYVGHHQVVQNSLDNLMMAYIQGRNM